MSLILKVLDPVRRWYCRQPQGSLRRRGLVPLLKLASRASLGSLPVITVPDAGHIRFTPSDSMILPRIYWFGIYGYEGILGDYWRIYCRNAHSILEVGANIGFYTVLGAHENSNAQYVAVEPVPMNSQLLRQNVELNGLRHVRILQAAAVGKTAGDTVALKIPRERHSVTVGAFITDSEGVQDRDISETITVAAARMPVLAADADLIKIDAEGIEYQLLSSILSLISARKPTFFLEVLPQSTGLKAVIREMVADYGYRIFGIPEYHFYEPRELSINELESGALEAIFAKDVILTTRDLPSRANAVRERLGDLS